MKTRYCLQDIATAAGVPLSTAYSWRGVGLVPQPDVIVGKKGYYSEDSYTRVLGALLVKEQTEKFTRFKSKKN